MQEINRNDGQFLRILFAGTPLNAGQTLEALISAGIDIVGVLTRQDAEVGRKRVLTPSPVAIVAEEHGIPVVKSNNVDEFTLKQIAKLKPELGLVVAYGSLLDQTALSALERGWINLHYSLLPMLRGAAPVQAAIKNGMQETGITIFQLDEGMDTGDIILQVPTQVQPGENTARLLRRLTDLGVSGLLEALPAISAGFTKLIKQDASLATFAPKITRDDARISWQANCRDVENLVNAMNPEPMSWTTFQGQPFRILEARSSMQSFSQIDDSRQSGFVFESSSKILVACKSGDSLELQTVQPSGKNPMPAADWFRGLKSKDRVVFE